MSPTIGSFMDIGLKSSSDVADNRSILFLDYTLNNPDTLTKYKTAAQISHKVLETVAGMISSIFSTSR